MGVSLANAPPRAGDIEVLGSGSGTVAAGSAIVNIGSFTTTGDLSNNILVVEIDVVQASGAGSAPTFRLGHTNALFSSDAIYGSTSEGQLTLKIRRTASATYYTDVMNWINSTVSGGGGTTAAELNYSATEITYVNFQQQLTRTYAYRWIAYLVGVDVK